MIGKMSHTHGKPCSCPMCGNRRRSGFNKSEKLTRQEVRSIEDLNDTENDD